MHNVQGEPVNTLARPKARTVAEIFKEMGGSAYVAAQIGESENTVNAWIRRKAIPPKYWRSIVAVARAKRIFLGFDELLTHHEQRHSEACNE